MKNFLSPLTSIIPDNQFWTAHQAQDELEHAMDHV